MRAWQKTVLAAALCAITSLPVLAAPGGNKGPPPWAGGPGGNPNAPGQSKGKGAPVDDLTWVYGTAGSCHVHVTEAAPHGWQQSLLAGMAGEDRLVYLFAGEIHSEQPMVTRAEYYWRKLNRYMGRSTSVRPVLAAIFTPTCSDDLMHGLAQVSGAE